MAKDISIKKTVYQKDTFGKVIDRSFKSFTQPLTEAQERTISEFFDDYERLFLEIPAEGDIQSHRYLIQKSSELVDFEKDTQDIQPLLDEITALRNQILYQLGWEVGNVAWEVRQRAERQPILALAQRTNAGNVEAGSHRLHHVALSLGMPRRMLSCVAAHHIQTSTFCFYFILYFSYRGYGLVFAECLD